MAKKARLEIRIEEDAKVSLQTLATKYTESGTITELLTNFIYSVIESKDEESLKQLLK